MGVAAIDQAVKNVPTVRFNWHKKKTMALVQVRVPKIVSMANASIPPNEQNLRSHGTGIPRHQPLYVLEHSEVEDTKEVWE
jgi:hypothetical protein